jgi:quercetin dioxygenase-like cupin family protein
MKIVRATQLAAQAGDPSKWSGPVWRADILTTSTGGLRGNGFTYAPGQRSNWHVHEGEQALIVLSGRGLIMWEGLEAAEVVGPGDWVHVTPRGHRHRRHGLARPGRRRRVRCGAPE